MTRSSLDHEAALQARAETAGGAAGDAADVYRYIDYAVRHAAIPSPPAGFASQMERLAADHAEQARPEAWLLVAVLVVGTLALLLGLPQALDSLAMRADLLSGVPWPLLFATAAGLGAMAVIDKLLHRNAEGRA